jgi:hypothetical protein
MHKIGFGIMVASASVKFAARYYQQRSDCASNFAYKRFDPVLVFSSNAD